MSEAIHPIFIQGFYFADFLSGNICIRTFAYHELLKWLFYVYYRLKSLDF